LIVKPTQEILDHIFEIYKNTTGSVHPRPPLLEDVISALSKRGCFEYRAGSRWSPESKLYIDRSRIWFYPNYDSHGIREETKIKKAQDLFEEKVQEYFETLK